MTLIAFLTLEIPSKFTVVLMSKGLNQNRPREKCPQEFTVAAGAFRTTHFDGESLERAIQVGSTLENIEDVWVFGGMGR